MTDWTLSEATQKKSNAEVDDLGIFHAPDKNLFHYTSREAFWKIIDSETLLARHIKFSNDYEENEIGTQKIRNAMEKNGTTLTTNDTLPFMVCFCAEDDLLSQWRGYAKEGVALEFDFSKGLYGLGGGFSTYHCYTIANNDTYSAANKGETCLTEVSILEAGKKAEKKYYMGAIATPYEVIYTDSEEEADGNICSKIEAIVNQSSQEEQNKQIQGIIPYIKNDKFHEECEYRLIFDLQTLIKDSQLPILKAKYMYLEENGIRKPAIRVLFGNKQQEKEEKITKIYYADDKLEKLLLELKADLESTKSRKPAEVKIELVCEPDKYNMNPREIIISNSCFQENVCMELRKKLRQSVPAIDDVSIWCDGHLPIRRIIVAPSKDSQLMKCSIEEYKRTKYWMRDVKVDVSQIPLRT